MPYNKTTNQKAGQIYGRIALFALFFALIGAFIAPASTKAALYAVQPDNSITLTNLGGILSGYWIGAAAGTSSSSIGFVSIHIANYNPDNNPMGGCYFAQSSPYNPKVIKGNGSSTIEETYSASIVYDTGETPLENYFLSDKKYIFIITGGNFSGFEVNKWYGVEFSCGDAGRRVSIYGNSSGYLWGRVADAAADILGFDNNLVQPPPPVAGSCDVSDDTFLGDMRFAICQAFTKLFYPTASGQRWQKIKDDVSDKAPFAYFSLFFNTLTATTTSNISPAFTPTTAQDLSGFFNPIKNLFSWIIGLAALLYLIRRLTNIEL